MSQNTNADMNVDELLNQVYQIAAETDFDEYIRFVDDELMVIIPCDVIEENDNVDVRDMKSIERVTVTEDNKVVFEFKIWLVVRDPKQEEYEAAKQGVIDKQNSDEYDNSLGEIEQEFYDIGFEEAIVGEDEKPDEVIGSNIPKILLYHRDNGYSGPKYFGNALNYNRVSDFDPYLTDEMITDGEIIGLSDDEYPDIECEIPDETKYRFVFAIE